jgi:stringent starvation protein B
MDSKKPYLLRSICQWCEDIGDTPYLLVYCNKSVIVPKEFIVDNKITLNLSQSSVTNLLITDESVTFMARFNGVKKEVFIPIENVIAMFSNEKKDGVFFEIDQASLDLNELKPSESQKNKSKPNLKLVKN